MAQEGQDETWKEEALRLQQENPELTKREIAEKVGKPLQAVKRFFQQNASKHQIEAEPGHNGVAASPASPASKGAKDSASGVLFEIAEIPGKGRGMVAAEDLRKGQVVVVEAPMLFGESEAAVAAQFETLTENEKATIMDLWDCFAPKQDQTKRTLEGIVKGNVFGGAAHGICVCPTVARVNHSCVPNCSYYGQGVLCDNSNDSAAGIPLVANQDIAKGNELTVDYVGCCLCPMDVSTRARRASVLESHRFLCKCEACSASPEEQKQRDAVLAEVVKRLEFHKVATVPAMQDCMQPVFDDIEAARRALEYVDEALGQLLPSAYTHIPVHVEKMHQQFGFTAAFFLHQKTRDKDMLQKAGDYAVRAYSGLRLLNGGRDIADASQWKSIVKQLKKLGYVDSSAPAEGTKKS